MTRLFRGLNLSLGSATAGLSLDLCLSLRSTRFRLSRCLDCFFRSGSVRSALSALALLRDFSSGLAGLGAFGILYFVSAGGVSMSQGAGGVGRPFGFGCGFGVEVTVPFSTGSGAVEFDFTDAGQASTHAWLVSFIRLNQACTASFPPSWRVMTSFIIRIWQRSKCISETKETIIFAFLDQLTQYLS